MRNAGHTQAGERVTFDPDATAPLFQPGASEDYEQFRELMAHLEQIFWIGDSTDRLVRYVSPAYATISGRTCQSLIDDPATFIDSIHEDDRARMDGAIAGKRVGEGYDEEFRIVRPDGEISLIRRSSSRAWPTLILKPRRDTWPLRSTINRRRSGVTSIADSFSSWRGCTSSAATAH